MAKKTKNLEDYAHLYIGCKLVINTEDGERQGIFTGIDGEFGLEVAIIEGHHTSEHPEYFIHEEVKLVLRPISSMTDDEKAELDQLGREAWWTINPPSRQDKDYYLGVIRRQAEETKYYLSKHIDIFGLKEDRLAVYESDMG